jgi:hypothetical protein
VCDGDGTSCSLHLRLLLQLPQGSSISGAGTQPSSATGIAQPASLQLVSWLQAALEAILQTHMTPSPAQLQLSGVTVAWTASAADPFGVSTSPVGTRRHLTANTDSTTAQSGAEHLDSAGGFTVEAQHSSACPKQALPYGHADTHDSTCIEAPAAAQAPTAWALAVTHASVRRLQQVAGATASSNQVELDAFLDPGSLVSLGHVGAGVLGLGQLLASGLEQQVAPSSSDGPAAAGDPQLLRVMLVQRVGVCGNGVCEVGERQLLNSEGDVLQEAAAACVQDCPGSLALCPAPVGPVGDADRECGGNGRCIRTSGTCYCNAG